MARLSVAKMGKLVRESRELSLHLIDAVIVIDEEDSARGVF